ncbi:hypothetical protein O0L34_g11782 [Tuta absoluta]|nr:hypothetical protein O0L34_g11782 [Tuta absoluta]
MAYILLLGASVVAITILWYMLEYGSVKRRRMRELAACMPGPPGWPILGNALTFMAKPDDFLKIVMEQLLVKYGDYFRLWLGSELLVCVQNPSDIRLLLTSNKINLKGPMYEYMKVFVGPGVLSEGGPIWRSHRKIAAPSFNRRAIQKYSRIFNENAEQFAEGLTRKDPGETINIYHDAVKSTTLSVCQAIIGLSKEESRNIKSMDEIVRNTHEMYDFLFTNMTHWWFHISLVYWLFRKTREQYFVKLINEMTSDMLEKRRAALKVAVPEEPCVLDMMILSGEISEQNIKFETMTFFTASQEASAKILSSVLLILAYRPEWQDKVYQEIIEVLGPEDGPVTYEQLKHLKYLDMVYKEAIRIMPIAAFIQRTVEEEVAIDNGNIILPKGATVVIPMYAVHHDAKYWKDPYKVDPGRFLPENSKGRDPNAFVPYSLGAMDCIGRVLADSMVKTNVVHVLRKTQLEADGRIEDLELSVAISVKVTKGYNVRVKPRVVFAMSWALLSFLGILAAVWLRWRYRNRRLLQAAQQIPGPPPLPMLGNALQFMCQPEEFIRVLKELMLEYGEVFRFWLGPDLCVVVSNPDDLKVLLTNMKTSVKGPQYKYMADVLGGGILSGSGPAWRKHRKIATPNYGKRAIDSYSTVFNHEVELLMEKYRRMTRREIDIYKYIVQTTSYSVCRTLMGLTKDQTRNLPHIQDIIDETPVLYDIVFDRMTKWYLQIDPIFWISSYNQAQKKFISNITDFSTTILQHRMEHLKTLEETSKIDLMNSEEDCLKNTQLSVIDRFILSQELDADELLKETFTVFTSSQEASAKITSFLLLMMAYHQDCQEKLYAEIKSVLGDDDRPITDEDLKQMPYLEMVFKEILRLYPIGAILQRSITEDIQMGSGMLPAGSSLVIPIYHLQRDAKYWDRPDAFDPERFSPENVKKRHPFCYIPFSLGPMDCLGRYFGTKLVKTICVRVLQEFHISSKKTYQDLKLAISISVVSVDGFHATLTPRKKKS